MTPPPKPPERARIAESRDRTPTGRLVGYDRYPVFSIPGVPRGSRLVVEEIGQAPLRP